MGSILLSAMGRSSKCDQIVERTSKTTQMGEGEIMDMSKLPRLSKTPSSSASSKPSEPQSSPAKQPAEQAPSPGKTTACPDCAAPLRPGAKFCDNCGMPVRIARDLGASMMAEAWVSIGIGVFLLLWFPTMTKYVSSKLFHTKFAPYADLAGQPSDSVHYFVVDDEGKKVVTEIRPYPKTKPGENDPNFWNDLAISSFGLALIVEGISLVLSRRPAVIIFALLVTIAATILNLVYFTGTFNKVGIAQISALAVIFGGYMATYQFRLLRSVLSARRTPV